MTDTAASGLHDRLEAQMAAPMHAEVRAFAEALAHEAGALAVLFYGSNLRTGSLDGVLDFYVLLPGDAREEPAIWPRVSYHEREAGAGRLRAKVATLRMTTFARAAAGELLDTTIWARFVQPSALAWARDAAAREQMAAALEQASLTAAQLAAALGPARGSAQDYWRALFQATYKAEFRVEKPGREDDILSVNTAHFDGLLPRAFAAAGIEYEASGDTLAPRLSDDQRARIRRWWARRRRLGKPINLVRLIKASITFEGAARYAAWKIERHTGMPVPITPFRERYPILAAPGVLWALWRHRHRHQGGHHRAS